MMSHRPAKHVSGTDSALEVLAQVPLLSHLDEEQRRRVVASGSLRPLAKGEILFHEGGESDALWALVAGRMKLVRYSPKGREMLLHLVQPGQSFAEAALFGQRSYPATAEAVQQSEVWRLPRETLLRLIQDSPPLALAMVASVSMWTRRLANKMEMLTQRRVEERLAIYLLGRLGGRSPRAGETVPLNEPKHLIAAQCGTAPEVLSRTLKRLEEDGLIRPTADGLEIVDPGALCDLAELID